MQRLEVSCAVLCPLFIMQSTFYILRIVGRDSSVGIATRYGLDGPGIESRWGARFFAPVQTGPGAHPASYTMRTGSFSGLRGRVVALTTHHI
jgi:hypothetical protein